MPPVAFARHSHDPPLLSFPRSSSCLMVFHGSRHSLCQVVTVCLPQGCDNRLLRRAHVESNPLFFLESSIYAFTLQSCPCSLVWLSMLFLVRGCPCLYVPVSLSVPSLSLCALSLSLSVSLSVCPCLIYLTSSFSRSLSLSQSRSLCSCLFLSFSLFVTLFAASASASISLFVSVSLSVPTFSLTFFNET